MSQVRSLKQHLPELVEKAVARAVRDMLEPEFGDVQGVSALKKLAQEVEQWPSEADDWQWCARFAYQVIERRGTGGGSFRLLYAEFLQFAADQGLGRHFSVAAQRCAQVAEQWTHLSNVFREASKADPTTDQWAQLSRLSAIVADKEEQLWNGLAA